jgi:steroid 5-alpha reductase family enzyme
MSPITIDYLVLAAVTSVAMTLSFVWQKHRRNAGIVDITWACCLAFAALYFGAVGDGALLPRLLVGVLGACWGFRLAGHLLARVLEEPEDGRYKYLREHWKDDQLKFFLFFQAQVLLVLLFATPFYFATQNPADTLTMWMVLGILVWILAIAGESLADLQLARFRNDPSNKGKTCQIGLWAYSRHPNYFFEWLHWFSYCLFAIGVPYGYIALIGPITMFCTLSWFTGIPFVEAQALRSRGENYRQYQRTTSALIPWFRRKE